MNNLSSFIEELKNRLTLSSIIGRQVRLERSGHDFKALCPFHKEKTPSFQISDQKGFYYCFGCGSSGDAITFLMRTSNLSFFEALEQLAAEAGMEVPKPSPEQRKIVDNQKRLYELLEKAAAWFEKQLYSSQGQKALEYLKNRGISEATIANFRIGYALLDSHALPQFLTKAGFTQTEIIEAGLMKHREGRSDAYGFFRDRIMFPITDRTGRVIAFSGRILEGDGPKYINSPESSIFHKGHLLYGLSRARQAVADGNQVIVVEGQVDAITMITAGFGATLAPLGTALTEEQIQLLWKLIPTEQKTPILCFDGDMAGQKAAARAILRTLPLLQPNHSLHIAFMPQGEDPDSYLRKHGAEAMQAVIDSARPLIDVLWEINTSSRRSNTPEEKAGIQKLLEEQINTIKDASVRTFYANEIKNRIYTHFGRGSSFKAGAFRKSDRKPISSLQRNRPLDGQQQQQQLLLATLMNHPSLFVEVGELIGGASFEKGTLENVRGHLVSYLEQNSEPAPSTDMILKHFHSLGLEREISDIIGSKVVELSPFTAPLAEHDEARRGWLHIWSMMQKKNARKELVSASIELAKNPSDLSLSRLTEVAMLTFDDYKELDTE